MTLDRGSPRNLGAALRRTATAALLAAVALAPLGAHAADKVNTTGLAVTDKTVKVGILHSVTGTMAISETGSVQAEKLAIKQINDAGGVLGFFFLVGEEEVESGESGEGRPFVYRSVSLARLCFPLLFLLFSPCLSPVLSQSFGSHQRQSQRGPLRQRRRHHQRPSETPGRRRRRRHRARPRASLLLLLRFCSRFRSPPPAAGPCDEGSRGLRGQARRGASSSFFEVGRRRNQRQTEERFFFLPLL